MPDDEQEHNSSADSQARLEDERAKKEEEELASFERRAAWWKLHYGGAKRPDELTRTAVDQAERMPSESARDDDKRSDSGPSEDA
jgi:hypothetical protein